MSCKKFHLQTDLASIPSQGVWENNCFYKSRFLLKMLEKHQKPLVWIDADAVVLQNPTLFDTLTCDIGVRVRFDFPPKHRSKIVSCVIYLNHTQNTYDLLELWEKENQELIKSKAPFAWDQIALQNALLKMKHLSVFYLPPEYGQIYDQPLSQNPVIVDYQAATVLKLVTYNLPLSPNLQAFEERESMKRLLHRKITLKNYGIIP